MGTGTGMRTGTGMGMAQHDIKTALESDMKSDWNRVAITSHRVAWYWDSMASAIA
jgi:hypothetical protein